MGFSVAVSIEGLHVAFACCVFTGERASFVTKTYQIHGFTPVLLILINMINPAQQRAVQEVDRLHMLRLDAKAGLTIVGY